MLPRNRYWLGLSKGAKECCGKFMCAPEHWSGSCRTCRTACYGPAIQQNTALLSAILTEVTMLSVLTQLLSNAQ